MKQLNIALTLDTLYQVKLLSGSLKIIPAVHKDIELYALMTIKF
jgi:hypothetical protein